MADPRFAALSTDPRYRLPNRKEARTAVDPRFGGLFKDPEFRKKASVDRYGRKIKPEAGTKEVERLYRLDEGKDEVQSAKSKVKAKKESRTPVLASSGESEDESEKEVDDALVRPRDPARDGGFDASSSSDADSDDSDSDSASESSLLDATAGGEQTDPIPLGEVTHRIAAVNLDWDNIRASDILAVAASFAPSGGRVERVVVYPSEFGRERLGREETEGPPREIFKSHARETSGADELDQDESDESENGFEDESADGSEDGDSIEQADSDPDEDASIKKKLLAQQASEGDEFDTAALRNYQLERLRYYYAVITCDTDSTAKILYDAMDGREYLSSANFFDLRFIPDPTSFDGDEVRDECQSLPSGYKPNDFRTEALMHSKVRLTWDDDDTTRKEVQKRAFSRAELDENDLKAYIGSDESDADSMTSKKSAAEDRKAKKTEAKRSSMRAALGLSEAATGSKKGAKPEPVGDMQITFTSGLAATDTTKVKKGKKGVFENEPQDEESTRDRYIRKERERKLARKSRTKGSGAAVAEDEAVEQEDAGGSGDEDAGFEDPFFTDPTLAAQSEKQARKAAKEAKRAEREARDMEAAGRKAELELLLADDNKDGVRHFDMREIEKAEKAAKKKGRKGKKAKAVEVDEVDEQDRFKVDAADERFRDVFERHEYAIDPSNKKFKGTEGMKTLLEEGRRKRKGRGDEEEVEELGAGSKGDELQGLVKRLKGKNGRAK